LIKAAPIAEAYQQEVRRFSIKAGHRSNRITTLSGGNQQKVLIGRAFAKRASIIVLNDPARGVDLGTKRELYEELRRHAASGGSVIYLSSEIEEFLGFADRVVVFHKGTVFRSLAGRDISEDSVLAAMFGHTAPVSFDEDKQEIAS
jgi:ribose transport system ATP-binding protein